MEERRSMVICFDIRVVFLYLMHEALLRFMTLIHAKLFDEDAQNQIKP